MKKLSIILIFGVIFSFVIYAKDGKNVKNNEVNPVNALQQMFLLMKDPGYKEYQDTMIKYLANQEYNKLFILYRKDTIENAIVPIKEIEHNTQVVKLANGDIFNLDDIMVSKKILLIFGMYKKNPEINDVVAIYHKRLKFWMLLQVKKVDDKYVYVIDKNDKYKISKDKVYVVFTCKKFKMNLSENQLDKFFGDLDK